MPKVSDQLFTILFADDTCITLSDRNYSTLIYNLNNELSKIYGWLINDRLSLNMVKTVAINFSKRTIPTFNVPTLMVNNVPLTFSPRVKYLGVVLDTNLNYGDHVTMICKKISKSVGILYRLSFNTPSHILHKLYYSLIYPYLTYCNIVWGGACATHLHKLLLLQKCAVRTILNAGFLAHTEPLFEQTEILRIKDIHMYSCCMFAKNHWEDFDLASNPHNTRSRMSLNVNFQRLTTTQRSVYYCVPLLYNSLPEVLRHVTMTMGTFKHHLKQHLLGSYE